MISRAVTRAVEISKARFWWTPRSMASVGMLILTTAIRSSSCSLPSSACSSALRWWQRQAALGGPDGAVIVEDPLGRELPVLLVLVGVVEELFQQLALVVDRLVFRLVRVRLDDAILILAQRLGPVFLPALLKLAQGLLPLFFGDVLVGDDLLHQ